MSRPILDKSARLTSNVRDNFRIICASIYTFISIFCSVSYDQSRNTRIRAVTNLRAVAHFPRHMVAHRGWEDRGTISSITSCLDIRGRNDGEGRLPSIPQLQLTTPTTTRRQRRECNGPRLFGFGTDAFGFAAAATLGCRATHIPLSAPRFAISSSPPHRYYVLQSRIIVLTLYQLSIFSTSHLRHLPFSTFQVSRRPPYCSKYLTKSVGSRYTTVM